MQRDHVEKQRDGQQGLIVPVFDEIGGVGCNARGIG